MIGRSKRSKRWSTTEEGRERKSAGMKRGIEKWMAEMGEGIG